MSLIRKIRASGSTTVLAIPIQLVEIYTIGDRDEMEIITVDCGKTKIRKAKNHRGGVE